MKAPVEAPNMLWLIQRDFLEGKTVQQMVSEALSAVPNPSRNPDIAQVLHTSKRLQQHRTWRYILPGLSATIVHPMLALGHCRVGFPEWLCAASGKPVAVVDQKASGVVWVGPERGMGAQVNKIRESLERVVRNSSAAGLRQPHLERTRLCQLSDAELDPVYVRQRDALRETVRQLARPKRLNGQVCAAVAGAPLHGRQGLSALIFIKGSPQSYRESHGPHQFPLSHSVQSGAGQRR